VQLFMQTLVNGLSLGASYALIAVGLTIVFGIGKIVNFAHGDLLMVASYGVVFGAGLGLPYAAAAIVGLLVVLAIGFAIEKGIIARGLYTADHHVSIIVTFALALLLSNGAQVIFGPDAQAVASPLTSARLEVGGMALDGQRALTAVVGVVVLVGLALWLHRSKTGMQLRAVSQNPRGALYSGINVKRVRLLAFLLGAGLAGLAGVLLAPTQTAYPTLGHIAVVTAFTVVILGGLGSVSGAGFGGLVIGMVYAFVGTYVSVEWTTALGWVLVIIMLLVRPQGLLGMKPTRA
jgi:branched-chain amino acid transport system permease protein